MEEQNLEQLGANVADEISNEMEVAGDGRDGSNKTGSLGKFKDAQALLFAYNNLQSDYTKKCQALSLIQKKIKDETEEPHDKTQLEKVKLSEIDRDELLQEYIFSNEDLKDKILTKYFSDINLPKSPKLMGADRGSAPVMSPFSKPKTLEQAEILVRDMFDKK